MISHNLDLLRAIAVLCVFTSHFVEQFGVRDFGSLGRVGVILFFVHTSFVLMGSLERLEETSENDWKLVVGFWCRRLFRIYPLAMLVVLAIAIFHIPAHPGGVYVWIGWKGIVSNLALAQNLTYSPDILGVLWSLPLEVQMYVLLPALYFVVRGPRRYVSLLLWAVSVGLAMSLPEVSERLSVFRYGPCFMSGVLAYDLIRSKSWKWTLPAWVWPLGIAAAILLFGPHDNLSLGAKIGRAWGASLLIGVLYANVREGSDGLLRPVFHWIAEHSYGIYLSHTILMGFTISGMTFAPMWVRLTTLAVGAAVVPALLYVGIEKPLILVGGHVARRLMARHPQEAGIQVPING
jgi:peptidoglycan/LPS O-acetylase OafA/YrhL